MDFYFTDRKFNFLGVASTSSEAPITFANEEDKESIKDAARMLSGSIFFKPYQSEHVKTMAALGNYVLYQDENGKSVFSTIMEIEHDPTGEHYLVTEDAGMDLINGLVGPYQANKAMTFAEYFKLFAGGTGFEIGINEITQLSRTLKWESDEQTILSRMLSVATQFDNAEIDFSFTITGTQVIKRYLNVYKKRGANNRIVLYMNKDINNIVTKGNIYDLCTAIKGLGGDVDGVPVNLIGYNYTDPNGRFVLDRATGVMKDTESVKIWSRLLSNVNTAPTTGHIERRKSYETTNKKTLVDNVVRELERASQPTINYETDIAKLPKNVRIGDTVYLADEDENLFLSARVLELKRIYSDDDYKATLGDYLIEEDGFSQTLLMLQERLKQETTYLWIMYADDEQGNGISPNPAGKKFIAIKSVVGVPTASNNPEDYRGLWTQYVGGQGIQGPQGPDGKPRYTWIKYADDPQGKGMSDDPTGKWYLGTAENQTSETPSKDPAAYKWQLVKGEDGKDAKVYQAYAWSADGTDRFTPTYPNENLSVGASKPTMKTLNMTTAQYCAQEDTGVRVKAGVKYVYSIEGYSKEGLTLQTNLGLGKEAAGFTFDLTPIQILSKDRTVRAFTVTQAQIDSYGDFLTYRIRNDQKALTAVYGKLKVEEGTAATIFTTPPLDDFVNAWPTFMGTYTTFEDVQSLDPKRYTWARMLGMEGADGKPGGQGPQGPAGNGIKETIVAYAASTSGTVAPSTGWQAQPPTVAANSYLWTRVTLKYTTGEETHSYSVGKMGAEGPQGSTGGQGPQGPAGNGIAKSDVTYAASTSGTVAPSTGWQVTPPNVAANSYLWTKVILTYTNGTQTTSYSVGKMGAQGPQGGQGPQGPQGPTGPQGGQGPQGPAGINGAAYAQPTQPATTQEGAQWFKTVSTTDLTVVDVYTRQGGQWKRTPFAAGALSVSTISAISANLGNITAGNIRGVSIQGSEFLADFENVNVDGGPDISPSGARAKGTAKITRGMFSSEGTIDTTHRFKTEYSPVYVSSVVWRNGVSAPQKIYNLTHQGLYLMADGVGGTLRNQDLVSNGETEIPNTNPSNFVSYSQSAANKPVAQRLGRVVQLRGAFKNLKDIPAGTDGNMLMGTLPRWAWPTGTVNQLVQGTGSAIYLIYVQPNGEIHFGRYRGEVGGSYTYRICYAGSWLNIACVYAAADM